jgi:hypothetical protein
VGVGPPAATRGQVGRLLSADGGAGRFLPVTLYSCSGDRTGPLYVHAKIGTVAVIDEHWRPTAAEQRARREAGASLTHHLIELPRVSRRAALLLGPLQGLVVDG